MVKLTKFNIGMYIHFKIVTLYHRKLHHKENIGTFLSK